MLSLHQQWMENARACKVSRACAYKVIRADGGESGGEDFLAEELDIAAALGAATEATAKSGAEPLRDMLEQNTLSELDTATEQTKRNMEDTFAYEGTEDVVRTAIDATLVAGAATVGGVWGKDRLIDIDGILEGMVETTKYYTNNYFNNIVVPSLQTSVKNIILEPNDYSPTAFRLVREAMDARLKSVPYWRVVANSAASRSYHYGVIRAGEVTGYYGYRIEAIIDERTSAICREMNGKEFWLADASAHMRRTANARGDELTQVSPWVKADEVAGKSAGQLKEAGVLMPPFHGNCRTTIRLLRN